MHTFLAIEFILFYALDLTLIDWGSTNKVMHESSIFGSDSMALLLGMTRVFSLLFDRGTGRRYLLSSSS